uniref:Dynamin-like GTPase OPA1, mitochondrial n=1 Tax=Macrostomum lignano TaxID=282301 RepID=A0A1I8HXM6_9PLAT
MAALANKSSVALSRRCTTAHTSISSNSCALVPQRRALSASSSSGQQQGEQRRQRLRWLVRQTSLLRAVRLRYLLAAGAAAVAFESNRRYSEFKAGLSDTGWLTDRLRSFAELAANAGNGAAAKVRHVVDQKDHMHSAMQDFQSWLARHGSRTYTSLVSTGSDSAKRASAVAASWFSFDSDGKQQQPQEQQPDEQLRQQMLELQAKYQRELESLESEVRALRSQLAEAKRASRGGGSGSFSVSGGGGRQLHKSLVELYSEVLDALSEHDSKFSVADHLPRVVVVGDQSSGKTSVLEMIAKARIFPRGAGEMMTRAPVQVTLAEGPYHVARFKDNPSRMRSVVQSGGTVSAETISLSVQGPGLPRMVLVDLPGIISTETRGMASQTREAIRQLASQHMRNPNSIILCVADACVDPERSNAFDLVARHDPSGRRTIFVLTKLDLAERDRISPDRIGRLLAGRLLPLKALGYFAVVTGSGGADESIPAIQRYEEQFFRNSHRRFWALVQESVEAQADAFKASRFNLETEWKHMFPGRRQYSRAELFERARSDLLDEVIALSALPAKHWEDSLRAGLERSLTPQALDALLEFSALCNNGEDPSSHSAAAELQSRLDIWLRKWADTELPSQCVQTAWEELYAQLDGLPRQPDHDPVLEPLQAAVRAEARKAHRWDPKAEGALRVLQMAALDERAVPTRADWDGAVALLRRVLQRRLAEVESELAKSCGPGAWERWTQWRGRTEAQQRLVQLSNELRNCLLTGAAVGGRRNPAELSDEDLIAVRRNLLTKGVEGVTDEELRSAWPLVYRQFALRCGLDSCAQCAKLYYHYQQRIGTAADCIAVPFFYRVGRMLDATSSALRQQIVNNEAHRLEKAVKSVLDAWADDPAKLREYLRGRSVQLAEDVQRLRLVEEKLDQFIEALNATKDPKRSR